MAGGAGTRLWPLSRQDRPKQLLPLIRSGSAEDRARTLLEVAGARLEGVVAAERRYICTGERYRSAIRSAMPEFTDDRLLGEPAARDTVNAVGFAAAVFEKLDPDAVFVVLTADHIIEPEDLFRERIDLGFRLVEQDPSRLLTFSIKPTYPATGFGYIERGQPIMGVPGGSSSDVQPLAYHVARFVEKPSLAKAQGYLESGAFSWNSGMFVFHAATFMSCLARFKPESHDGLRRIQSAWGTDDQQRVLDEVYPNLPKISVDYAVMEPAAKDRKVSICTVLADVDWMDVGSWPSYADTLQADREGNRLGGEAKLVSVDSRDNLVVGDDAAHTIALLGCHDLIVVRTADATLVMPRDRAEQLKDLHEKLDAGLK